MQRLLWLCLPLVALLSHAPVEAQSIAWNLDPAHSRIGFTARHLGFAKVNGELKTFSATIKGDATSAKLDSVEATADAASVSTGIDKRDVHLKSDDFFAAAKFPSMKLKTKSIQWKGSSFTAKADLTIRNITKEVVLEGELLGVQKVNFGQGAQMRAAYEAKTTINRKDFGLNFAGLAEGISIVGDQVTIELSVEVSHL
jgi:polyisoprenoid-binding protein YceI